jgi:hypothetical protein
MGEQRNLLKRRHHIELPVTATWGDAVVAMRTQAALHETPAAKEIREAVEGRSTQRLEFSTPDDSETDIHLSKDNSIEELRAKVSALTERIRARVPNTRTD